MIPKHAHPKYYDRNPTTDLITGDVWANLPSFGLFEQSLIHGIIITPSCDLTWCKTSTATYLPIIPLSQAQRTEVFHPAIKKELTKLLRSLNLDQEIDSIFPSYASPNRRTLEELEIEIHNPTRIQNHCKAHQTALDKVDAILNVLKNSIFGEETSPVPRIASIIPAKDWESILEKIVTNSHRPDIHFLPEDGYAAVDWPNLEEPSLVFFRCPITVPISMLHRAQTASDEQWSDSSFRITGLDSHLVPEKRPLKILRLQLSFLHDLIARYIALYARVGSPDFTPEAVASYKEQFKQI